MKTLFCALLLMANIAQADEVLNVFNWNNAISAETIKRFEQHCQCKVQETYYGSMEEMLAKLAAGARGFDVMGPANYGLTALIKQGMLQPLDHRKLPNLKHLHPKFINTPLDPGNIYSVPYDFTVTLVGYNVQKIKALKLDPSSWRMIFDPTILAKIKGKVTVLDDSREVIAAALRYHGFSANSTRPAELAQAKATILKAKPYWAAFNSQSYIKELTLGNIWVALGYSNDMYQAQQDAKAAKRPFTLAFQLQQEGNGMTADSFVIQKGAPRPDLAHTFINFMLAGDNAADITNRIGSGTPNLNAVRFIKPELRTVETINPSAAALSKLEQLTDLNATARREWSRAWTQIKVAK
jgi:spermidine/putrescine transport system substrate-binding protein